MDMWKRVQHILSLTADLLQIGGFFGLTPAAFVTLVCAIAGWASNIPVFYLVTGSILVFAASLYLTRELIVRIGAISLAEGARIAYEQLRGTLWASAAEKLRVNSTPEGILDYLGTGITLEIPVFGKYPPSTKFERVKLHELKSGSIEEGASVLQLRDQHRSQITDLTIRKADLRKAIHHMKESTKEYSR
jgi:hypothetical protein